MGTRPVSRQLTGNFEEEQETTFPKPPSQTKVSHIQSLKDSTVSNGSKSSKSSISRGRTRPMAGVKTVVSKKKRDSSNSKEKKLKSSNLSKKS